MNIQYGSGASILKNINLNPHNFLLDIDFSPPDPQNWQESGSVKRTWLDIFCAWNTIGRNRQNIDITLPQFKEMSWSNQIAYLTLRTEIVCFSGYVICFSRALSIFGWASIVGEKTLDQTLLSVSLANSSKLNNKSQKRTLF